MSSYLREAGLSLTKILDLDGNIEMLLDEAPELTS